MPKWLLRSRNSRSAGMLRRHTDVPRAFAPQGATRDSRMSVVCVRCRMHAIAWKDPTSVRKRWAEPRSMRESQGWGSPRLTRTQAVSRDEADRDSDISTSKTYIRTNPRDASSRGFFVVRRSVSAGVQSFPPRIAQKRSNAAMPSSTVTRSITASCSILLPHLSSLAGLPRYLRAASS